MPHPRPCLAQARATIVGQHAGLLPISLGPLWMRVLAHVNPLYYLVEASRALAAGTFGGPAVWQAFAVLTPLCAITLGWATRVFRHAVA
jgi:ABC-2 type transport system permease protein